MPDPLGDRQERADALDPPVEPVGKGLLELLPALGMLSLKASVLALILAAFVGPLLGVIGCVAL